MKKDLKLKHTRAKRRVMRVRSKIFGTPEKPRLSVYRSSKHLYVQVIDDQESATIAQANTRQLTEEKVTKTQKAEKIGIILATQLSKKGIKKVVFDRGSYKYTGRVRQLADAVRKSGITI